MSTIIVRRITASPVRTSSETWAVICELLAPDAKSSAREILTRASGVACSSIASEVFKGDPAVVQGSGPRVRFYALYDDDAMAGEDASEEKLSENPTTGDWRMSIPVSAEDYEWSARAIKSCAPHITVRKAGESVSADADAKSDSRSTLSINLEEFLKS